MPELPDTQYYLKTEEFYKAVGEDFIKYANRILDRGHKFIVGLSHGHSPSGVYKYILENYDRISTPANVLFTFVNSPMPRQREVRDVIDAREFIKKLFRAGLITRRQIIGYDFNRDTIEEYTESFNKSISYYMREYEKKGFDYVFLGCNPEGRVAAITRESRAFECKDNVVIVIDRGEKQVTVTPVFLLKSSRIAFLATKADKRRPLAWLYAVDVRDNESPGFLRYMPDVKKKMTIFIDDKALTWPQIEVYRKTPYGVSTIRIDTGHPYDENVKEKLPVIILVHGFLGLNSFDGLLASISAQHFITAAMHYGTIPNDLPPSEYSYHITRNIEAVVEHFGAKGHPVYIFDHSMGNVYSMMIDQKLSEYPAIKKYLRGRIAANPFFGEEAKHAVLGFLDNVILPALSGLKGIAVKGLMLTMRSVIPLDTKIGVRRRGIELCDWMIRRDSSLRDRIWQSVKERILFLMTNMDSLPHLNRIPIEQALSRLPAKVLAIQIYSALEVSKKFDEQSGLLSFPKKNIPVLVLKSERDGVAKYVPRFYEGDHIEVIDVTNKHEHDLFQEHLYHMTAPKQTTEVIERFINTIEQTYQQKAAQSAI